MNENFKKKSENFYRNGKKGILIGSLISLVIDKGYCRCFNYMYCYVILTNKYLSIPKMLLNIKLKLKGIGTICINTSS